MRAAVLALLLSVGLRAAESKCNACHVQQAGHYSATPMANALLKPAESAILTRLSPLTFSDGRYRYNIAGNEYTVTDGQNTLTVAIVWSFGAGVAGQTYVFQHEGNLYESRVSYYPRIKALDLTLGAVGSKPADIVTAAGRRMNYDDVAQCFGCHSTSPEPRFNLANMTAGVQCAACHAGVSKHEADIRSLPVKLNKLSTEEMSELCGRCHRTWEQISINGPKGINNVRFQPYRLTNSKCYDDDDRRISCVACHEPHSPLETRAESYDSKCTACHAKGSGSKAAARICKVSTTRCTECHMPQLEIPGSHMVFNDHQIRIARRNEVYPN